MIKTAGIRNLVHTSLALHCSSNVIWLFVSYVYQANSCKKFTGQSSSFFLFHFMTPKIDRVKQQEVECSKPDMWIHYSVVS